MLWAEEKLLLLVEEKRLLLVEEKRLLEIGLLGQQEQELVLLIHQELL